MAEGLKNGKTKICQLYFLEILPFVSTHNTLELFGIRCVVLCVMIMEEVLINVFVTNCVKEI